MKRQVVILQEHLPHYRLRFYECLREELSERGVDLKLIYSPRTSLAAVPGALEWGKEIKCRRMGPLVWQPCGKDLSGADLIVVQQENKYIINYLLWLKSLIGMGRLAFWGHGRNFQTVNRNSWAEKTKRFISQRVHWWFAYNDLSARVVKGFGFNPGKITSVRNSIDTRALIEARKNLTAGDLEKVRSELGITSNNVCVYTGRFDERKKIKFLVEACKLIRSKIPDFEMLFIGGGVLEEYVNDASIQYEWLHFLGIKNDLEKVPYWGISKLLLMPGWVGLVVIDSFALGTPMVTLESIYHSPEIDYLVDGVNGLVVKGDSELNDYANAVVDVLGDDEKLEKMKAQAILSCDEYSAEIMAKNFAEGIESALS